MKRAKQAALGLVLVLMLAGTFAWYFRADLLVDLSTWWAACVRL